MISRRTLVIVAIVGALFAVAAAAVTSASGPRSGGDPGATLPAGGASSPTSARNDAMSDYEAALKTGKKVYVLFHSLTCVPCVEISAAADRVVPDYADDIVFVNAISDDPSAQRLASKLPFQYIPTSFFVASDGRVLDSYTGPLSEDELRARLDQLSAR